MLKKNDMAEDRALIIRLKNDDETAFDEIYRKFFPKLLYIGKRYSTGFLSPKDFAHEAFIRLIKYKESLKEDAPLDSQMMVICRNLVINHINREKRIDSVDESFNEIPDDGLNGMDLEDVPSEKYQRILKIIEELPNKRKEIFKLHKMEYYTYEEIEEITGLSQKTIANHIYLAKEAIKESLATAKD